MSLALVKNSEEFFLHTSVQVIFKGTNTLKANLMYPKDKIPSHLKQDIVYKWSCQEENCNLSYIGKSSWCLGNRIKEHRSQIFSAIYQHSVSNHHPKANISHFKIIDQDSKQVAREAREAIHIRINNPDLNCNMGKMYIPEILNNLPWSDVSTNESYSLGDSDHPQSHIHLTVPSNRFARAVCLAK